jgi:hypothetical protein|uniref:Uncharacterized protein n=1 Tax=Zea mays TaxID=4577 RepID=A0A804P1F3_MAIZE
MIAHSVGQISLSVANPAITKPNPKQSSSHLIPNTTHTTTLPVRLSRKRSTSEHVACHRTPGGHGGAAGLGPVASEARPPLLRRLLPAPRRRARGAGGGVLVAAAEEGDQAPHEDAAQEDAAVGHQAPPHAVPAAAAAPAGLDARRLRRHGGRGGGGGPGTRRDSRPRRGRGHRLRPPRRVAKVVPLNLRISCFSLRFII